MAFGGLSGIIDRVTPSWAKPAAVKHWLSLFRLTGGILVDGLLEGVYTGRAAGSPGAVEVPGVAAYAGFDDVGSLDHIARDRGVQFSLTSTPPDRAYQLRHWLDPAAGGWAAGGTVGGVLQQLALVLGPTPPLMRIMQAEGGDWWTREQDGTIRLQRANGQGMAWAPDGSVTADTTVAQVVDWDSATVPAPIDQSYVGRWILVFYAPIDTPYGTIDDGIFTDPGILQDFWNDYFDQSPDPGPWEGSIGTNAPQALVALVLYTILSRQMAGLQCIFVVYARASGSFNPDGSSALYPDGTWGWHSKLDPTTNARIPARDPTAEYWRVPWP